MSGRRKLGESAEPSNVFTSAVLISVPLLTAYEDPLHIGERPDLKSKVIVPDILIQAHSASLQMTFYTGNQFPTEYNGNISRNCLQHGFISERAILGYLKVLRTVLQSPPIPSGKR
jgi:hypothetical protein